MFCLLSFAYRAKNFFGGFECSKTYRMIFLKSQKKFMWVLGTLWKNRLKKRSEGNRNIKKLTPTIICFWLLHAYTQAFVILSLKKTSFRLDNRLRVYGILRIRYLLYVNLRIPKVLHNQYMHIMLHIKYCHVFQI